jgi:hypothetical protein
MTSHVWPAISHAINVLNLSATTTVGAFDGLPHSHSTRMYVTASQPA